MLLREMVNVLREEYDATVTRFSRAPKNDGWRQEATQNIAKEYNDLRDEYMHEACHLRSLQIFLNEMGIDKSIGTKRSFIGLGSVVHGHD